MSDKSGGGVSEKIDTIEHNNVGLVPEIQSVGNAVKFKNINPCLAS
jgi:hypothetical protein